MPHTLQTGVIEDTTPWPGRFFGCFPDNPTGFPLRFRRTTAGCQGTHSLAARHCGPGGMAHGGIVSTLLDETAAWALIMHAGCLGLSTRMEVEVNSPVRISQLLFLEAWVVSGHGRHATTRAEVRLPEAPLPASCEADWALGLGQRRGAHERSRQQPSGVLLPIRRPLAGGALMPAMPAPGATSGIPCHP